MNVEAREIALLIEDDMEITAGNVHVCKLRKDPRTGWLLDENIYQASFYDRTADFEVSNLYDNVEDAVLMFLEMRNITTILTNDGIRIKSAQAQYNEIFKYKPSAYGEIGRRRLKTQPRPRKQRRR